MTKSATKRTPEERARTRAKNYTDVMWHSLTFAIVNGLLWWLDIAKGDGLNWAFWLTIFWGIGLAFHVAWYFIGNNEGGRYQRFLAEERARAGKTFAK